MLIESLPHEDLDDGLPTDVQFTSSKIQFTEHVLCEVHIHSLYRRHHSTCVGKVARNIMTTLRPLCNRFGRDRVPGLRSFLHKVFAPPLLLSRAKPMERFGSEPLIYWLSAQIDVRHNCGNNPAVLLVEWFFSEK